MVFYRGGNWEKERREGKGCVPNIDENKGLGFEDFTPVCAAVRI
jgi:hypothetical protein